MILNLLNMWQKVFKFNYVECTWIEKKSSGDFALFLGDNISIAMLASNILRCQQNYIYFNHDFERMTDITFGNRGPPNFGMCDLKTRTFTCRTSSFLRHLIFFKHLKFSFFFFLGVCA